MSDEQREDEVVEYAVGSTASGRANRHTFAGLTDAAFRMVPLLEAGRNSAWPWLDGDPIG